MSEDREDRLRRMLERGLQEAQAEEEAAKAAPAQPKAVDEPEEATTTVVTNTSMPSAVVRRLRPRPAVLPLRTWDEVKVPAGANDIERMGYVPGLVGDVTQWIYANARRPNRMMALGTALTLVGTLIGHRVRGPTQSSTALAKT
jgi:hypothetical protein